MIQEDVQLYYTMDIDIHMQQIAAGIVILSALGAVMDTALSVTSAVYEVSVHKSGLDRREYFHSGLQVGKRHHRNEPLIRCCLHILGSR